MDEYRTIRTATTGILKEKGSKFIAFAHPVQNADEIRGILAKLRREYHDARHHCYAWRLGDEPGEFRQNDDGEPSGTAGKPIYGQILSMELHYILIVVIRYFGGVLLGTGGLIQAYKGAAREALTAAEIITLPVTQVLKIRFDYPLMNEVMKMVKDEELTIVSQDFDLDGRMELRVSRSKLVRVVNRLRALEGSEILNGTVVDNFLKR